MCRIVRDIFFNSNSVCEDEKRIFSVLVLCLVRT